MKRPVHPFLAGAFCFVAIYGCLWLVGFVMKRTIKSAFGGDILAVTESTSPNHQYVATTYTDMGGGAAGWCYRIVALRRIDQQFDPKNNRVFSIRCNTGVEVAWRDDSKILITWSTDTESVSLYQKSWSDDRAIRISYAETIRTPTPQ